jgi:hypothetical protein
MATGVGAVNLGKAEDFDEATTPFTLEASGLLSAAIFGDIELLPVGLSGALQGPVPLPAFTLSGAAATGRAAQASLFLPAPSVAGAMLAGGGATGACTLPGFTLAASTGNRGSARLSQFWVSLTARGVTGNVSKGGGKNTPAGATISETVIRLPVFGLSGAMRSQLLSTGAAALPAFTLQAAVTSGASGEANLPLRAPRVSALGLTGTAPSGSVALPALTLSGATANGTVATGAAALPLPTMASLLQPAAPLNGTATGVALALAATMDSGVLLPGTIATAALTMREPTLGGVLANSPPMTGAATLAEFTLSAQGLGSNAAVGFVRMSEAYLSAQGLTGNTSSAELVVPLLSLSAQDGVLDVVGAASLSLPLLSMTSGATMALAAISESLTGIVLNSRTRAVSEYTGFAPNSVAAFQGVTLFATANGIVALSGDSDLGEPIEARIATGITDLGSSAMKRVLTAYLGYRADGDMELTLIADDHHEHVYTLEPRRVEDQLHATRAKFGRGVSGVYWQFKAANVEGSDFAIDRIEPHSASTGAKV